MSYRGVPPTTASLPVLTVSRSHVVELSNALSNAILSVYASDSRRNNADGAEVAENEVPRLSCNRICSVGSSI